MPFCRVAGAPRSAYTKSHMTYISVNFINKIHTVKKINIIWNSFRILFY